MVTDFNYTRWSANDFMVCWGKFTSIWTYFITIGNCFLVIFIQILRAVLKIILLFGNMVCFLFGFHCLPQIIWKCGCGSRLIMLFFWEQLF